MEREKQKQMEREKEKAERAEFLTRKKEETEDAMKILQASGLPEKSKFVSDYFILITYLIVVFI